MTEHDPLPTAEDVQRADHIKALQRVRFWCHRDSQRTSLDELERAEHAEETAALDFAIAALAAQAVPAADAVRALVAKWRAEAARGRSAADRPGIKTETSITMHAIVDSMLQLADELEASAPAAPVSEAGDARDAERLDWIWRQSDQFDFGLIQDAPGDGDAYVHGMFPAYGQGPTFRDAIDAAIAATPKGQEPSNAE